jgi:CRP-like cAMP-binding protein
MAKKDTAIITALAGVPLFDGCNKKQLRTIAASGKMAKRKTGTTIVKEGSSGVGFFVIVEGTANVLRGGDWVARLTPGDFFGEMALLLDERRNAEVVAADDCELFTLTRWAFKSIVMTNPQICYSVMQTIAARQVAT